MHIDWLLRSFDRIREEDAIIWQDRPMSYRELGEAVIRFQQVISEEGLQPGAVVSLEADFSPSAVAVLLALINCSCAVVPLTSSVEALKPDFRRFAEVEAVVEVDRYDQIHVKETEKQATHQHYRCLREQGCPALVLFSSGSTGIPKASVHNLIPLLQKFEVRRHAWRTVAFLLFDHIGGFNTLFYTLSNGGCVVTVGDRSPESVCDSIDRNRVQMLPTSPTFINLLLISRAYEERDMSSLEIVTYGTEVMPKSTLERFRTAFPNVRMLQTYGLSEVGILRSKSRSSDSLWLKIGGQGFETRVVDGLLEIKAESAMLGYLNAPSPFTEDGWFMTGDEVEVDGEYLRFLGRREEIINVGGEKIYPIEVENVLQEMRGVADVAVAGEANAITGQMVTATIRLQTDESAREFRKRMRAFCLDRLHEFKIPQKITLVDHDLHGKRFKKNRRVNSESS